MPILRTTNAELQFLQDREDWFVCRLENSEENAKTNLARIIEAEAWMQEHCEPDLAFRFGSTFYFKHEHDHVQFTLMWS